MESEKLGRQEMEIEETESEKIESKRKAIKWREKMESKKTMSKKTRSSKDECSTYDQTIILGLVIFLDHISSRSIVVMAIQILIITNTSWWILAMSWS